MYKRTWGLNTQTSPPPFTPLRVTPTRRNRRTRKKYGSPSDVRAGPLESAVLYVYGRGRVYSTWWYVRPKVVRQVFLAVSRHGAVRTALPACPAKVGIKKNIVRNGPKAGGSASSSHLSTNPPRTVPRSSRDIGNKFIGRFGVWRCTTREHLGRGRAGKNISTRVSSDVFVGLPVVGGGVEFLSTRGPPPPPPPRVFTTCAAKIVSRRRRWPVGYYTSIRTYDMHIILCEKVTFGVARYYYY